LLRASFTQAHRTCPPVWLSQARSKLLVVCVARSTLPVLSGPGIIALWTRRLADAPAPVAFSTVQQAGSRAVPTKSLRVRRCHGATVPSTTTPGPERTSPISRLKLASNAVARAMVSSTTILDPERTLYRSAAWSSHRTRVARATFTVSKAMILDPREPLQINRERLASKTSQDPSLRSRARPQD
jgi:hypothetical protein